MKKYVILEMVLAAALVNCGMGYQIDLDHKRDANTEIAQRELPRPEIRTEMPGTVEPSFETPVGAESIPTPSIFHETSAASDERQPQALRTRGAGPIQVTALAHSLNDPVDPLAGTDPDILLIDEHFVNSEGWDQFDNKYARGSIENGHYSLTIKSERRWSWVLHGPRGSSFYYQGTVMVSECKPGDNYGLVFRAKDDGSFMLFSARCQGEYRLVRVTKGVFEEIITWTPSAAVNNHHYLRVADTESGLTLRDGPSLHATVSHFAEDSEVFLVEDGPRHADGLTWWLLTDRNNILRSGWGAAKYLRETRTNVLGVRAEGDRFNLHINGEYIGVATDATFSGGKFGIYAASQATQGLHVAFDDLIVYPVIGRGVPLAPSPTGETTP